MRVLLKGGRIVTMNAGRDVVHGDVLIEGDRIAAIGELKGVGKVDERIDCKGALVIPGLVQPHLHLAHTLFRGRTEGLEHADWQRERIWPLEAAHDHDSLYVSAMLGSIELLRSGTTAILDHGTVRHTEAIFEAARDAGLRATIGKAMMDRGQGLPAGLRESTESSLEESLALATRWHGTEGGRLRYGFAPRFVLTTSEALLKRVVVEARARGLSIHTHASESQAELPAVREQCGADNVTYLHSLGMSGKDVVLAHCVWLTSAEQRILRETGTHVVHCPSANLKLGCGIAKVPDLLRMGVNVGLAAESAAAIGHTDLFEEMRIAALVHSPRSGAYSLPAKVVFEMATVRGARALGLEAEIGSIEPGKKADLAVVRADRAHEVPGDDPYATLVHSARASDVDTVLVDGQVRVRGGVVQGVNLPRLLAKARELAAALPK